MPQRPRSQTFTHDDAVARVHALGRDLDAREVGAAYLASFGSGPIWHRPTLEHFAYAMALPEHEFQAPFGGNSCIVCGMYDEVKADLEDARENKEKYGYGPADCEVVAALIDLEDYATRPRVQPTADDVGRFDALLDLLAKVQPETPPSGLHRSWQGPKTNRYTRDAILETLGACGLLETRDHVGFFTRWTGVWDRQERPSQRADLKQPVVYWRGADRVNRAALDFFFPQPGIGRERFSTPTHSKRVVEDEAVTLPRPRDLGRVPRRVLSPGDVLDFERGGVHLAAIVRGCFDDGKRKLPVIEFCVGTTKRVADLSKSRPRLMGPYREGPRWRRQAIACEGLELFGTLWKEYELEIVARGAEVPNAAAFPEADLRIVRASGLLYMTSGAAVQLPAEPA